MMTELITLPKKSNSLFVFTATKSGNPFSFDLLVHGENVDEKERDSPTTV